MIYYGKQHINEADIDAVIKVLQSDFITQGPSIERFEQSVAAYCGAKYAVAVSNATAALHISCLAAGLKEGDVLWTSPNTFVASANCGRYCRANVDFVDIDERTYNLSVEKLEEKLAHSHIKPKIVIPVHFSGQPCDMERVYHLSKKYGFYIIEDASHAIGAEYKGEKVGACTYSDMTVFSFHPVKIVTTGEGGMILTNQKPLYESLKLLRSHGITRNPELLQAADGPWYYEQIDLGFNYRMTDLQAALGESQMSRLDEFVERRRILAQQYHILLQDLPLKIPFEQDLSRSSWHLYVVRCDFDQMKLTKKKLFASMLEREVCLNLHYIPIHLQPYYQKLGFKIGDFPVSERYYQEVFTLPLYYSLTDEQQKSIVHKLKEVLQ